MLSLSLLMATPRWLSNLLTVTVAARRTHRPVVSRPPCARHHHDLPVRNELGRAGRVNLSHRDRSLADCLADTRPRPACEQGPRLRGSRLGAGHEPCSHAKAAGSRRTGSGIKIASGRI